jgi:transaldolase
VRLFLDTANIDHIRQAAKLGVISGVTTNPTLISQEGRSAYKDIVLEIASIIDGPISVEALSKDASAIVKEAHRLASWHPNIVVKIPITPAGLEATSLLSREDIRVNLTLCFSLNQALLGALAGAYFVSPFVGRLDDAGHDGMQLVADIVEVFNNYKFPTQVVAASIRHPLHCVAAAKAGAHIATVPYPVLMQMIAHPLTAAGISRFNEDWAKLKKLNSNI